MVTKKKPVSRRDALLARMAPATEAESRPAFIGQVYGLPGSGKTTLVAGLAQALKGDGSILWTDSSDGFMALADEDWALEDVIYNGPHFPADDLTALAVALAEARETGEEPLASVKVLVLDEFSSWYKEVLDDAVRARAGISEDENMPEVLGSDHSLPAGVLESAFKRLHKIPDLHVIVVAHAREKAEKALGGTRVIYSPNYPPLMNVNMQAKFHSSVFLRKKLDGKNRPIRTVVPQQTSYVEAKNRISGMPDHEIDPAEYVQRVVAWVNKDRYQGPTKDLSDEPETPDEQ